MLHNMKDAHKLSRRHMNTPNDQTSDLLLNLQYLMTSGADHLTGNLEHWELVYWSSSTNLQRTDVETVSHHTVHRPQIQLRK